MLGSYLLMPFPGSLAIPMDYNYMYHMDADGSIMEPDYQRSIISGYNDRNQMPWNIGHHLDHYSHGAYFEVFKRVFRFAAQGCPDEHGAPRCPVMDFPSLRELQHPQARHGLALPGRGEAHAQEGVVGGAQHRVATTGQLAEQLSRRAGVATPSLPDDWRGERAPTLSAEDLDARARRLVSPRRGRGHAPGAGEPRGGELAGGAAQAAVWLMAQQEQFGLSDLHSKLAEAGFPLHSDSLNELAQRLSLSGICCRQGDVFGFSVPLLREAIAALDVRFRLDQLRGGSSPASQG